MGIFSIFQGGAKYFDKKITPKCDYCQYGKRSNAGNKILCEKKGLVDPNYSCNNFNYSPLKRIPVKQLNFVGSLADEDIYIESKGDIAEKEAAEKAAEAETKKNQPKPAPAPAPQQVAPAPQAPGPQQTQVQPAQNAAPVQQVSKPEQQAPAQQLTTPAPQAPGPQQTAPAPQAPAPVSQPQPQQQTNQQ
ncbi:MAG TPA: hypothetical protein P5191_08460 [Ruminococcus sp.]|nr:hypothetical protein [Ruminococcus sp.]